MNSDEQWDELSGKTVTAEPLLDEVERLTTIKRMQAESGNTVVGNFNLMNPDDELANILMDCVEPIRLFDVKEGTIKAVYIRVRETTVFDREAKEMVGKNRTEIMDVDGKVWATGSPVAGRMALSILSGSMGMHKLDPPLDLIFKSVPTGSGGTCIVIYTTLESLLRIQQSQKAR